MSLEDIKKKLFMFYAHTPGQLIELPYGHILMSKLKKIVRHIYKQYNFLEVSSATFGDKHIWEKTGHLRFFEDNMFYMNKYYMKPMNCPVHMLIIQKLYDDYSHFPIKIFEFNYCFRKELSGSLSGLNRLFRFTQDDSHQIIYKLNIRNSLNDFIHIVKHIYSLLNINEFKFRLSNVSEDCSINYKLCNNAFISMKNILDDCGVNYYETYDGAFYGPKLDVIIVDSLNREWQAGTFQIDFCILKNISFKMRNKDSIDDICVIHHAFLGTFERFVGILLDILDYIPSSINPFKYYFIIVHKTDIVYDFLNNIKNKYLLHEDSHYIFNDNNDDINIKVKAAYSLKYEYIIFIGNDEATNNNISYRIKGSNKYYKKSVIEFFND